MRTRIKKAEEGSVLILGIGLLGVCLLALVVVADAGSAFLQRKNLYSVADAAAFSLCRENNLPIVVFNLLQNGNIARAVRGEAIGTLVN